MQSGILITATLYIYANWSEYADSVLKMLFNLFTYSADYRELRILLTLTYILFKVTYICCRLIKCNVLEHL